MRVATFGEGDPDQPDKKEAVVRIWEKFGDRELFWTMLALAGIAVWATNAFL